MKKINKKETKNKYNPDKYIELNPTETVDVSIKEASNRVAVVTFGRFNPLTVGHEKLVNKLTSVAAAQKGTPMVFLSHTQDKKKNPLSYADKLRFSRIAFGPVVKQSQAKTIIQVAKEIQQKFDSIIVVVGADRISEFETLLNKYNGTEYNYESIKVISAGDRDPDADDVTGMSASKMRALAMVGNFEMFAKGLPTKLKGSTAAEEIYKTVREGMGLMENYISEDAGGRVWTLAQRRAAARELRRRRPRLKIAIEKAKRRMATTDKLKLRAQRKARDIIRNRLMKSKKYSEMSPQEKMALDKRMKNISPSAIKRIATRQLPAVRRAEMERLADMRKTKTENVDLNTLFEQFVNEPPENRKKNFRYLFTREGKVNLDQRFKMYRPKTIMGENIEEALLELIEAVNDIDKLKPINREHGTDSLVKILKKDTPGEVASESAKYYTGLSKSTSEKRSAHFEKGAAMDDDNPAAYKQAPGDARAKTKPSIHTKRYKEIFESEQLAGVKKKAEETGISYGILKQVFDRGVAAWRTGHRPGTTPSQWGYARINSFATGGKTRTTADADLWAKHSGKKNESIDNISQEDIHNPDSIIFSIDEIFEFRFMTEASILDKALDAIRRHVLRGKDLQDVIREFDRLVGAPISTRELYNAYVNTYGNPYEKPPIDKEKAAKLMKKYGFKATS